MSQADLARDVVRVLTERNVTVAVAESLTGGELCSRIVDVPGASVVLRGAVVAYATELKQTILGVDGALLSNGGPVQGEVAQQMATGVARLCGSDYGLATTGVAGPGDSPDGPAGLVYVAVAGPHPGQDPVVVELRLRGTRPEVRAGAVHAALDLALSVLLASGDVD